MRFKKILSFILSVVIVFTFLSNYNFVKAQENPYTSYLNELEKLFLWEKLNYTAQGNYVYEQTKNNKKEIDKYDINLNYNMDRKNNKGEIDFELKTTLPNYNNLQKIKIFHHKDDFYVNKEFLNKTFKEKYINKVFTKDFVKLVFNDNNAYYNELDFSPSIFKNDFFKNSSNTSKKFLKFFRETDFKMDLGLTKNNNVYSFTWDESKLLDVINEYVKYLLTHPDYFIMFLEEVLDVDIENFYFSKEEIIIMMPFLYQSWVEEVEQKLPKYKEMFKGTKISFKEKFEENVYTSEYKVILKIDTNKRYLIDDMEKPEKSNDEIMVISFNPDLPDIKTHSTCYFN